MGSNAKGHRYRSRSPLPGGSRSTHHDRRRSRSRPRSERLEDKWDRRHREERDTRRDRSRSRDRDKDRDRHRRRHEDTDGRRSRDADTHRRHHRSDRHDRHRSSCSPSKDEPPKPLPFNSRQLSRSDYPNFEPLFAHYLDIQKQLYIDDLDDHELRGRWKSFVKKWNRGELAEGWYDPERFASAAKEAAAEGRIPRSITETTSSKDRDRKERGVSATSDGPAHPGSEARPSIETSAIPIPDTANHPVEAATSNPNPEIPDEDSEEDSDYGPTLPGQQSSSSRSHPHSQKHGPTIPSFSDLTLHHELLAEELQSQRASSIELLRAQRKADRTLQKERLDDLLPRADAGTRERRLEKRKELNEKMKSFREPSPGGEVPENELMGGGDGNGGLEEYKRMMKREEIKKTERQLRREEMERARAAEREERIMEAREREERVMEGLRALAKARFG